MKDWDESRQWRKATRAELLAQRLAIPRTEKLFRRPIIGGLISGHFPELRHACIGFYWPFKGEIDLRHLVRDFIAPAPLPPPGWSCRNPPAPAPHPDNGR